MKTKELGQDMCQLYAQKKKMAITSTVLVDATWGKGWVWLARAVLSPVKSPDGKGKPASRSRVPSRGPKQSKRNRGFYRTPLTSGEGEIATAAEKNTQAQRQQPEGVGFRDRRRLDNL